MDSERERRRRIIVAATLCLLYDYYYSYVDESTDSDESSSSDQSEVESTCRSKRKREEKKEKEDDDFVRSQITKLVASCTNEPEVLQATSIEQAIRVLRATPEIYEDRLLYLNSMKLLENPTRREFFMNMSPDRRVKYLRFLYGNRDL